MTEKKKYFADQPTIKVSKKDQAKLSKKPIPLVVPPPTMNRPGIMEKFKAFVSGKKISEYAESEGRYEVGELLGAGGSGKVYSVKDKDLQRIVAIKVTGCKKEKRDKAILELTREAKVLANLEHPNIIPVHDIDMQDDGKIYLSMRKITGHSLKELLKSVEKGNIPKELKTYDDVIRIILKVCDALNYAHSKGCLHQDIKPDNIMIGEFGEVFLIDWGSSFSADDDESIHVTPGYMSPEQSIGDDTDQTTDVYSLGTTLFHALYHRLPTNAGELSAMIDKKRKGVIDPLTEHEKAKVPAPLEAIVMKALELKPEDRYQIIAEMADDLDNFQTGQSVSVYGDSFLAFARRWYNRNKRHIWYTFFICLILVLSGTVLWHEKLKEVAYWGTPKYKISFNDKSLQENWIGYKGKFKLGKEGGIVSDYPYGSIIVFNKKLHGSIAVEVDAEMLKGYSPGDLSLMWIESIEWEKPGQIKKIDGVYYFQTGSWDNSFCMIQQPPMRLAISPKKLKFGQRYKIRIEIDNRTLRLILDGEIICEYTSYMTFGSGYIAIYAYHAGKSFSNVKIYSKGVPEKVGILAIGDEFFRQQEFAGAVRAYDKVVSGTNNDKIHEEALYRKGLSLFMMGDKNQAFQVWGQINDRMLQQRVKLHSVRMLFNENRYAEVETVLTELYANADEEFSREIELEWADFIRLLLNRENRTAMRHFIRIKEKLFPDKPMPQFTAARVLSYLREYEKILQKHKDIRRYYLDALLHRGELQKIIANPMGLNEVLIDALRRAGRQEEVIKRFPDRKHERAVDLFDKKLYEELLEKHPDQNYYCALALIALGRAEEVLQKYPNEKKMVNAALITLGRYNEILKNDTDYVLPFTYAACSVDRPELALKKFPDNTDVQVFVKYYEALKEYFGEEKKTGVIELKKLLKFGYDIPNKTYYAGRFYFYFLPLILDMNKPGGLKSKDALKEMFDTVKKKYRYTGSQRFYYLLALLTGKIDKEKFYSQEMKLGLDFEYEIYQTLNAEYNGDFSKTIECYRKLADHHDVKSDSTLFAEFVKKRLKELESQK